MRADALHAPSLRLRREHLRDRAAGVVVPGTPTTSPPRSRSRGGWASRARARRGHEPRRADGRPGGRPRLLPPPEPDRRGRRRRQDRAGPARRRTGPAERRGRAGPDVRPGRLHQQPRDDRRDDRQQLGGQPLAPLRHRRSITSKRSTSSCPTASSRLDFASTPPCSKPAGDTLADRSTRARRPRRPPRSALARFPLWRHSGGYRLDRAADRRPLHLAQADRGVGGNAGRGHRGVGPTWSTRPTRACDRRRHFTSTAGAIAATLTRWRSTPLGRDDRPHDPRPVPPADGVRRPVPRPSSAIRTPCCSSSSPATPGRGARGGSGSPPTWESHGHGYHTLLATSAREQANVLKVRKAGLGS